MSFISLACNAAAVSLCRLSDQLTGRLVAGSSCRIKGFYNDVELKLKTTSTDAQLLWISDEPNVEFLSLRLRDGFVELGYNVGSGDVWMSWTTYRVDDSAWHVVNVKRFVKSTTLVRVHVGS